MRLCEKLGVRTRESRNYARPIKAIRKEKKARKKEAERSGKKWKEVERRSRGETEKGRGIVYM